MSDLTIKTSTTDDPTTPSTSTLTSSLSAPPLLPRITIQFCTQCKWMLRAAYFAQELLSTFSTALGEVALQPATGGVFVVEIVHRESEGDHDDDDDAAEKAQKRTVLWDRKVDGGFPETKELKRRVRDVVWPGKGLGHVDRDYGGKKNGGEEEAEEEGGKKKKTEDDVKEVIKDGKTEEEEEVKETAKEGKNCRVDLKGNGDKCEDCCQKAT
ncbi:Rdx family-domain-containing protein [Cladorrhinum sp. PSN259]|nr:Rdx family-domain-containing protein [Cladorrhinum sp. PSN259]